VILQGIELILSTKKKPKIALFKRDGSIYTMHINQMYCIEVIPKEKRKLRVHERYGITEIISTISEIASNLDDMFFQCHKPYIINFRYIKNIDIKKRIVYLEKGHKIPISFRCLARLQKAYLYYLVNEGK
jgi:two-component system response regulator AgrA